MQYIRILIIAVEVGVGLGLMTGQARAADQTTALMLEGKSCAAHLKEISEGLMGVKGVKAVDLKSMKGHALVTYDATVKPEVLIDALTKVKGSEAGQEWFCDAEVMQ